MGFEYSDLTIQVRRDSEQGYYFFGVVLDGAFQVLGTLPATQVDSSIAVAQDVAAGRYQPPQPHAGEAGSTSAPWWVVGDSASSTSAAPAPGPDEPQPTGQQQPPQQ